MDTRELFQATLDFEKAWVATGGEAVAKPWGRIVRNLRYPRIYLANLAWVDRLPDAGPAAVLEDLDAAFAGTSVRHRHVVFSDAQEAFQHQAFFAERGLQPLGELVLAKLGLPVCITNPDLELRVVGEKASEEDYGLVRRSIFASLGYDAEESAQLLAIGQEWAKALGWTRFVAYLKGERAGTIALWPRGPHALLEDVATLPEHRMRGVARTMMFEASKRALRAGCEWVLLTASLLDTPRIMYQTLGFQPVGEIRDFLRP